MVKQVRSGRLPHDLPDLEEIPGDSEADFAALMERISGGISLEEARFLAGCAEAVQEGCIVEIGSFRGKSAVALSIGANRANRGTQIYCVEPHRPATGVYGGEFGPADRKEFFRAMVATGAYRNTALINHSSEIVAGQWQESVALCFIDGDHTYAAVRRDYNCWADKIMPGGMLILDDAKDPRIGPAKLLTELLSSETWEPVSAPGKLVALRKRNTAALSSSAEPRPLRILVACGRLGLTGGLMRFERLARVIAPWGHRLSFLPLAGRAAEFQVSSQILTWQEARERYWDAVMVPGAGFPDDVIARFSDLREPQFGIRVQHILNDQQRADAFAAVNASLDPDLVIFNNRGWREGSFTTFRGRQFHVLEGAVDTSYFAPSTRDLPFSRAGRIQGRIVVGGQARKNAAPLVAALALLPETVQLQLFGDVPSGLKEKHQDLVREGRLAFVGRLSEAGMRAFYHQVDLVVSTETFAGWSNMAAEAAACGVPVVCTPAGTGAFAHDGESAVVLTEPTAEAVADAIRLVIQDTASALDRAAAARSAITKFDWHDYGAKLVRLLLRRPDHHYFMAPHLGLHGKWSVKDRLQGLEEVFMLCKGLDVLDLGAAEGLVSLQCLESGARGITAFELDPDRVQTGRALLARMGHSDRATFQTGNVRNWDKFVADQGARLASQYGMVLYLGLHHHVGSRHERLAALRGALSLAKAYFVIRTPRRFWEEDAIDEEIRGHGWTKRNAAETGDDRSYLGDLRIYER